MAVDAARFERAEEIFHAAAALDLDARATFLDRACGADPELRQEVESLFSVAAAPPSFLDEPLIGMPSGPDPPVDADPPDITLPFTIASYRLVREIGHGGMGRVYEAEQDGVGRHVAIKLLRPAMASAHFLRRFRAEQKILAGLEHAGIARLYDAGTSERGVPYLAMEYVQGVNLIEYCTAHRLGLNERLRLFARVCEAVQYAHQHLVVHRDLKPSNILVTHDGEPKLLDFGIAKLISEELDATDINATVTGLRLMTPDYASPEQVRGEHVTTSSDVYSLGVVLYELLTSRRPYRLTTRNPRELERSVLEHTPVRPSTAVRRGGESPDDRPPSFPGSAKRHASALRGDLDNIVLKALAKDVPKRYATADELAEDVRRHLAGLPVRARPDTLRYRARKFVSRHRWAVASGVVVTVSLLIALAVTVNAVIEARRERDLAAKRLGDVRHLANTFLFDVDAKIKDLSGATAARELLVSTGLGYLDRLSADAGDDPSLLRELANGYERLGDVQGALLFANLGQSEAALASYRKASSLRRRLSQSSAVDTDALRESARSELRLSDALFRVGNVKEAPQHSALAVALLTRAVSNDPNQLEIKRERADALTSQAFSVAASGDLQGSVKYLRESIAFFEGLPREKLNDPTFGARYSFALFRTMQILAELPDKQGMPEALTIAPRAVELDRALLAAAPNLAGLRRGLQRDLSKSADLFAAMERHEQAVTYYAEAARIAEEDVARDPNDRLVRRNISVARTREVRSLLALGRTVDARAIIDPTLTETARLLAEDPKNITMQLTFVEGSTYFGRMAVAVADRSLLTRARTSLVKAVEVMTPLVTSGTATGEDARQLDLAKAALAACDEALHTAPSSR